MDQGHRPTQKQKNKKKTGGGTQVRDGGVEWCGRKEHKTWATGKGRRWTDTKNNTKLRVEHKHTQGKKEGGRLTEGCVWGGVRHNQTGVREIMTEEGEG